jgi:hypothetical protein
MATWPGSPGQVAGVAVAWNTGCPGRSGSSETPFHVA